MDRALRIDVHFVCLSVCPFVSRAYCHYLTAGNATLLPMAHKVNNPHRKMQTNPRHYHELDKCIWRQIRFSLDLQTTEMATGRAWNEQLHIQWQIRSKWRTKRCYKQQNDASCMISEDTRNERNFTGYNEYAKGRVYSSGANARVMQRKSQWFQSASGVGQIRGTVVSIVLGQRCP